MAATGRLTKSAQEFNNYMQKLRDVSAQEKITMEQWRELNNEAAAMEAKEGWFGIGGLSTKEKLTIKTILDDMKEYITLQESTDMSWVEGNFEDALKKAREGVELWKNYSKEAGSALKEHKDAATTVRDSTVDLQANLQNAVGPAEAIADNMVRAALAANSMSPGVTSPETTAYAGRYFAAGGHARGIDTIPAMLAPNEFVINQRSSRRFFSQLQAINAGQRPVYRNEGGSVTNIGDVSITVQDSGSPQSTAREVMKAIRRESRRGASRI
jgi:hypothetical protein